MASDFIDALIEQFIVAQHRPLGPRSEAVDGTCKLIIDDPALAAVQKNGEHRGLEDVNFEPDRYYL